MENRDKTMLYIWRVHIGHLTYAKLTSLQYKAAKSGGFNRILYIAPGNCDWTHEMNEFHLDELKPGTPEYSWAIGMVLMGEATIMEVPDEL